MQKMHQVERANQFPMLMGQGDRTKQAYSAKE